METKKAEELANESKELFNNYALGYDSGDFGSSIKYLINEEGLLKALVHFINSRQSEIDELTKEVERLRKEKEWKKFKDELPTNVNGEQVDILFGHPKWATYMRGMYTHWEALPLIERLAEYKPDIDKFCVWESMIPTHWMKLPNNPQ